MKREGQVFIKLSLGFFDDPKIIAAGEGAAFAYIAILAYCKQHRTNGLLRCEQLVRLGLRHPNDKVRTLCRVGLLDVAPESDDSDAVAGWVVRGWFNWNDTPSEQEERSMRNSLNGSKGGRPRKPPESGVGLDQKGRLREEKSKRREELTTLPTPAATARAREPDLLFEAIAEVCEIDWHELTPSARGSLGKAVSELRKVGATPEEVVVRAQRYREGFDAPLTPPALAKHWPRFATEPRPPPPKPSANQMMIDAVFGHLHGNGSNGNGVIETTARRSDAG